MILRQLAGSLGFYAKYMPLQVLVRKRVGENGPKVGQISIRQSNLAPQRRIVTVCRSQNTINPGVLGK
jgi:hypothetical protein